MREEYIRERKIQEKLNAASQEIVKAISNNVK